LVINRNAHVIEDDFDVFKTFGVNKFRGETVIKIGESEITLRFAFADKGLNFKCGFKAAHTCRPHVVES
jgi:hypothetical protein